MAQLDYNNQESAVGGQIYGVGPHDILTYNNPVDVIRFGCAVAKVSTDDDGIEKPDSSGADIVGVAILDKALEYDSDNENSYPAESSVSVLRRGEIYVYCEEAVTPDDPVYTRYTASGSNTVLGAFRTDADSSKALLLSNCAYLTSADAGGYAVLAVNLD